MLHVPRGPTLRAVDAAGAALGWARSPLLVACHRLCRSMEAASGATDAVRWAATVARALFMREDIKECALSFSHRSRVKIPKNVPYRSAIVPA